MFDENFLFDNFEEKPSNNSSESLGEGKKARKRKRSLSNGGGEQVDQSLEENCAHQQYLEDKIVLKDRLIQDLEKQNEKLKAAMKRICGPQIITNNEHIEDIDRNHQHPLAILLLPRNPIACHYHNTISDFIETLPKDDKVLKEAFEAQINAPQQSSVPIRAFACDQRGSRYHAPKSDSNYLHIINATQFYTDHCLDRTGQPLNMNSTSQSDMWIIPPYEQVYFNSIPKFEGSNVRAAKTPSKAACFNCGGFEHNLQDCTEPRDQIKINENRKAFVEKRGTPMIKKTRYHVSNYQDQEKFKPGILSKALQDALGMGVKDLPPYIYKMRVMGYPPGYSAPGDDALLLFDQDEEGEVNQSPEPTHINYPGFNYPLPPDCVDNYRDFNVPPYNNSKEQLTKNYELSSKHLQGKNVIDTIENTDGMDIDELEATPVIHVKDVNPTGVTNIDVSDSVQFINESLSNENNPEKSNEIKNSDEAILLAESTSTLEVKESSDHLTIETNEIAMETSTNHCRKWWTLDSILSTPSLCNDNTSAVYQPPPTCKYNVRIEDIPKNMITYPELIRDPSISDDLLYPLYGHLSTPTGVYDNIRTRLKKRKSIPRSTLSL